MLPKVRITSKKTQMNVPEHKIPYKKVSGGIYLSPSRGELGGSKDDHFRNKKMYKNGKVDSLQGRTLPKVRIILKKASNRSS